MRWLLVNESASDQLFLCILFHLCSLFNQLPLVHPLPLQLLLDDAGIVGIRVCNFPRFNLLFFLVDCGDRHRAELAHVLCVLGHHDLLGLNCCLEEHTGLERAFPCPEHRPLHHKSDVALGVVLIEQQQVAFFALLPVLAFDAFWSLQVNDFVRAERQLVSVLGSVDHPRTVSGTQRKLLNRTIQDHRHTTTYAIVHIQRLLLVVLFLILGVGTHNAPRNYFRHLESKTRPDI
uniref:Uncharacterized protein n=1 Tax=Ixodes ricinus TaxID=34613 RepID=A0A6B0V6D0_IXORI